MKDAFVSLVVLIIASAFVGACRYTWASRRRVVSVPRGWWRTLRRRRTRDEKNDLVEQVKRAAGVRGPEVPLKVEGSDPWRVIWYPSHRVTLRYRDHSGYLAAADRGEHGGYNAGIGLPTPVAGWSIEHLRRWLSTLPAPGA